MSYSICRPINVRYAQSLKRKWNLTVSPSKDFEYVDDLGVTRNGASKKVYNIEQRYPSALGFLTMELTGNRRLVPDPRSEHVQLKVLELVCSSMLKTDHTSAKVILTFVDDACHLYYAHRNGSPINGVDLTLLNWNSLSLDGQRTVYEELFQFTKIWVSAFQSFIEMTDYRYEIWGYNWYNQFSADFVL